MKEHYEQTSIFADAEQEQGAVECLGHTFANEEARRFYFLDILREKLRDPAFRQIEGFPLGEDEDILALSDPPYYTACPNPFIEEFVRYYGKPYDPGVAYSRKPLAIDVSEGKTDPIYTAHSYHTKVPPKAIMRAILHYTEPGDVILDGFAGSGMTGVAAQLCANPDSIFKKIIEDEWSSENNDQLKWGARKVILNDIGPAATFIAANYNIPFDVDAFESEAKQILQEAKQEFGWMYETLHTDGKTIGQINYTVWSEVFSCPNCSEEIIFLKEALDQKTKATKDFFACPNCSIKLTKDNLVRFMSTYIDKSTNLSFQRIRMTPIFINYTVKNIKYEKPLDKNDFALLSTIDTLPYETVFPKNPFHTNEMYHGSRLAPKGFTHIHHLYLSRVTKALGYLWRKATIIQDIRARNILIFFIEQAFWTSSLLNRYRPTGYSQVNQYMPGVYYIASQHAECSPWYILSNKLERLVKIFKQFSGVNGMAIVNTGSAAQLNVPDDSIDYIFTDPPFGENIYYADLNFLVESWYKVWTNTKTEAIIDHAKHKGLIEYQELMLRCFSEYYRVLKPGRWMTMVFSNARNAVWNAIQEAVQGAGFVVADVRTLDKQQGSYRQVTSNAVKQDLVISAYKPNGGLEQRFRLEAGTEEGCWDFTRTHLRQLPVFVAKGMQAETIAERMPYFLFDRMVAFHVQHGVTVPLSSAEFYQGLAQRFSERDSMYFLPEQVAEYDKKRITVNEIQQLQLIVTDEASAIQWLRQQIAKKPQTFQEIHPLYMRELGGWLKHEKMLELAELLEQSFLRYEGTGEVPSQIHSYLSSNYKEMRNLAKDDPALQEKAKGRWYIPDPNKATDLEKLREKGLLKEFEEYRAFSGRKLKLFRLEAVRAGFKKAWQERNYQLIVEVAKKIPESILQEDSKLVMWYDQAITRTENEQ